MHKFIFLCLLCSFSFKVKGQDELKLSEKFTIIGDEINYEMALFLLEKDTVSFLSDSRDYEVWKDNFGEKTKNKKIAGRIEKEKIQLRGDLKTNSSDTLTIFDAQVNKLISFIEEGLDSTTRKGTNALLLQKLNRVKFNNYEKMGIGIIGLKITDDDDDLNVPVKVEMFNDSINFIRNEFQQDVKRIDQKITWVLISFPLIIFGLFAFCLYFKKNEKGTDDNLEKRVKNVEGKVEPLMTGYEKLAEDALTQIKLADLDLVNKNSLHQTLDLLRDEISKKIAEEPEDVQSSDPKRVLSGNTNENKGSSILYLKFPEESDGSFRVEQATIEEENDTRFVVDTSTGQFWPVENANKQRLSIDNYKAVLKPTCDISGNDKGVRIELIFKGKLTKTEGRWHIDKKCQIKIV